MHQVLILAMVVRFNLGLPIFFKKNKKMTVADTCSNYLGVEITEPDFPSTFYPLPDSKYLLIHTGSFSNSRIYDYYNKVIELLQFNLDLGDYTVVQIGEFPQNNPDGSKKQGDYQIFATKYLDLRGKLSLRQQVFLIENCELLLCNESVYSNIAGVKEKKSVVLYGPTPHISTRSCFAFRECAIESGPPYSYLADENPKSINSIKPEEIAGKVSRIMNLGWKQTIETIQINDQFLNPSIDFIPDFPIQPGNPGKFLCRFDLSNNIQALGHFYSLYSAPLYTADPVDERFLAQFKSQIPHVFYSLDGVYSRDFVVLLHKMGFKYTLLTDKEGDELDKLKWDLFDYNGVVSKNIVPKFEEASKLNLTGDESFDTSRLYLSRGKIYPSRWHWQEGVDCVEWQGKGKKLGPVNSKNFMESWNNFYIFEVIPNERWGKSDTFNQ